MCIQVLSRVLGGAEEDFRAMKIRLIGYRCAGKTTVGRALARRLGIPFWDTDLVLEERAGKSISLMVRQLGWEGFRVMEREVVRETLEMHPAVVALGGGAILDPGNRKALGGTGLTVWLEASAESILKRMARDPENEKKRPALTSRDEREEVAHLLAEREPLYKEAAQARVCTDRKSVEEILEEILVLVGGPGQHKYFASGD